MNFTQLRMKRMKRLKEYFVLVLVLGVLNSIVFYKHILGTATFPWDFAQTYYALPYYWTSSISQGIFPFWVPFQGMGYPLLMNLQTGIFYIPMYFFVLFKIPYTLYAANIFQIIHVFWGALGMYFLVNRLLKIKSIAILAAVAFNLYGGFYCNSEHVDIIRGFSFIPWIIYSLPLSKNEKLEYRTLTLFPLFILLLWTGGYPGIYMSTTFLCFSYLGVYVVVYKQNLKIVLITSLLIILGIGMATINFLPAYLLQSEISRSSDVVIEKTFLLPSHLLSLFYPIYYKSLPSDISMRSIHIVLPVLFFISYLKFEDLKKYLALLVIAVFAYFMASGSFIYFLVIKILPPLGLSRFPNSDYKTFFAIVILMFCSIGVKNFLSTQNFKFLSIRIGVLVFLFITLYFLITKKRLEKDIFFGGLLIIFTLGALCFYYFKNKISIKLFIVGLVFLSFADFAKNNYKKNNYFVDKTTVGEYNKLFGNLRKPPELLEKRLNGIVTRPVRNFDFKAHKLGFKGYFTGDYMVGDYTGPMQFRRQKNILSDSGLLHFAIAHWKAIDNDSVKSLSNYDSLPFNLTESNRIKNVFYGCNYLKYTVNSTTSFSITENETYFKGWSAVIDTADQGVTIYPTENKGFRAWSLPAGNYKMTATFKMPYFDLASKLSIIFFLLWFVLIFIFKKYF